MPLTRHKLLHTTCWRTQIVNCKFNKVTRIAPASKFKTMHITGATTTTLSILLYLSSTLYVYHICSCIKHSAFEWGYLKLYSIISIIIISYSLFGCRYISVAGLYCKYHSISNILRYKSIYIQSSYCCMATATSFLKSRNSWFVNFIQLSILINVFLCC